MPTRQDFQRLVEWCDRDAPLRWLKSVAGVALRCIRRSRSALRAHALRHSGLVTSHSAR
jgi:hypothetical protein